MPERELCPQIVIGLISPIGTDTTKVLEKIKGCLSVMDYSLQEIKISKLLEHFIEDKDKIKSKKPISFFDRKTKLMLAGDRLREKAKDPSVCATLAIQKIRSLRKDQYTDRKVFVVNSIKHASELAYLKSVYGRRFISIAILSKHSQRIEYLSKKIKSAEPDHSYNSDNLKILANDLIQKDKKDLQNKAGQQVADCIPLADAFIASENAEPTIERIISLWLGNPFITPTVEEQSMFFAHVAALKSSDLSRQVGASIVNRLGDILSTGCNEVPKPLGGYFWDGDSPDYRDFQREYDENHAQKRRLLSELLGLIPNNILPEDQRESLIMQLTQGDLNASYKEVRAANLIEFGRMVHAEMAAINTAARIGQAIDSATLFCTTFPCHMCSKLIISTGIKEVVYIEPYEKSMSNELFHGLILIENEESPEDSKLTPVVFRPFIGVSPIRYEEFFCFKGNRKDGNGRVISWDPKNAQPEHDLLVETILEQELGALTKLEKVIELISAKSQEEERQ